MNVIHLLPALEQGGVESVVCDLVRCFRIQVPGSGFQVESVVVSKGGRLVARVEQAGGRHIALDLKSKNPLTYFSRALRLRAVLCAEKPDLVCVHSRVPAWLFVGARAIDSLLKPSNSQTFKLSNIPWITYAHGANSVSRYSEVMTKGDRVIVPSEFLAGYLKANYKITDEKIRVVPNPVDTERFDPAKLDAAFIAEKRREWGIREGDFVQMAIGRITPVKGLEGLIRAVSASRRDADGTVGRLFDSVPSPSSATGAGKSDKLVIVGSADKHHRKYLESLRRLASTVRVRPTTNYQLPTTNSSVVFAGPQDKIPECIAIADEIVSGNTTKPETFGLSVVEAYAMNKPVRLARRFGGAAEVMDAVERSGCATTREAVLKLYGKDLFARRTLAVYREVCRA